jgi:ribose-phosphate pyrophosphokinase
MRQDSIFNPGEGVTNYFAHLVSGFDSLITIDPHLHRIKIPIRNLQHTKVSHAANHISAWIKKNIVSPILIGPDAESEQWVSEVAKMPSPLYYIDKN